MHAEQPAWFHMTEPHLQETTEWRKHELEAAVKQAFVPQIQNIVTAGNELKMILLRTQKIPYESLNVCIVGTK
jgi:hypothetical protein